RVQARRDERPELVDPHRCEQNGTCREADLHLDHEGLERHGLQQLAFPAAGIPHVFRNLTVRTCDELTERRDRPDAVAEPQEAEDAAQDEGDQRVAETAAELVDVLDERHRAVGVVPTAPCLPLAVAALALSGGVSHESVPFSIRRGGVSRSSVPARRPAASSARRAGAAAAPPGRPSKSWRSPRVWTWWRPRPPASTRSAWCPRAWASPGRQPAPRRAHPACPWSPP